MDELSYRSSIVEDSLAICSSQGRIWKFAVVESLIYASFI
jgi:hypothetical protein